MSSDPRPDEESWLCKHGDVWVIANHTEGDISMARNRTDKPRKSFLLLDTEEARQLIECLSYAIAAIEARPETDDTPQPAPQAQEKP